MSLEYHHLDKWAFANLDLVEEALESNKKPAVLISGASSSGKSYSAAFLEKFLAKNGHRAITISLDQYNVGLSHIIPNKVRDNYFDGHIEHLSEIEEIIKKIIYDVPFDKKYDQNVLKDIRKAVESYFSKEDLDKFINALYAEWKVLNFDEPTVYDLKEAAEDVKILLSGGSIQTKKYSKVVSERVPSDETVSGNDYDVILIEGIYALDPTLVDAPEYMFAYVEPLFAINDLLSVGVQGEYHTMTLDSDAELAQAFIGPKAYFSPVEKLSMDGYFRACIPLGDDYGDSDDVYFGAGASVSFEF